MAAITNKPSTSDVEAQLLGIDLAAFDTQRLQAFLAVQLHRSIAQVQDRAATFFDGRAVHEVRDGNGTNALSLFLSPATSCSLVKVELPVLGLTRTYTESEIKLYRRQAWLSIFTFKMGVEQASLHLDQQIYGNIFPKLPRSVFIDYTAGYPLYDATLDLTSLDGTWDPVASPLTVLHGDQRDPRELDRLEQLQEAVCCDAAAAFLNRVARNPKGYVTGVSFDGFSKSFDPAAYQAQAQELSGRYDAIMGRRTRRMYLSSV